MEGQKSMASSEDLKGIITQAGTSLFDLSSSDPVLLIFLRHFGCVFCKEALIDLSKKEAEFTKNGFKIVFVHMASDEVAKEYFAQYSLSNYDTVSDPNCEVYKQFGLSKGSFNQLFGLQVMIRGFEATKMPGNSFSLKQVGDGLQMPGIFLLRNSQIQNSYIHRKASDRPDYEEFLTCCVA